jgi:hypothetical protein
MTSMAAPVLDLELDFAASLDAELGLLGDGGSAGLAAGVADPGLPVPLGLATGLLAGVDPYALDGDARVDLIRGLERCRAMLDAVQQRAIAAVAEATEGLGRPAEEVARELVHWLPAVQAVLQTGAIGYLQVAAVPQHGLDRERQPEHEDREPPRHQAVLEHPRPAYGEDHDQRGRRDRHDHGRVAAEQQPRGRPALTR